jgi:hypothetical protein
MSVWNLIWESQAMASDNKVQSRFELDVAPKDAVWHSIALDSNVSGTIPR